MRSQKTKRSKKIKKKLGSKEQSIRNVDKSVDNEGDYDQISTEMIKPIDDFSESEFHFMRVARRDIAKIFLSFAIASIYFAGIAYLFFKTDYLARAAEFLAKASGLLG